jgi:hypothetical protein
MTHTLNHCFLAGTILCLCLILSCMPVSAADTAPCTRSFNIVLQLSPAGVDERAVEIVYGTSPHPAGGQGTLAGQVLAADGTVLQEFPLWDPRVQFGDRIVVDENGRVKETAGIFEREANATLAVMFPWSANAATFALRDEKRTLLASVDLTKAENKATWDCRPGWGITPPDVSGTPPADAPRPTQQTPVGTATLLLAAVAAAGAAIRVRRI